MLSTMKLSMCSERRDRGTRSTSILAIRRHPRDGSTMGKVNWKSKGEILAHYRPQVQQAVNRALLVGEDAAKVNTPVGRVRGGTLRRSIHVDPGPEHPTRV